MDKELMLRIFRAGFRCGEHHTEFRRNSKSPSRELRYASAEEIEADAESIVNALSTEHRKANTFELTELEIVAAATMGVHTHAWGRRRTVTAWLMQRD